MPEAILSIQSAVAYGHVGNAAAAFILQRLGFDVLRLDTVAFSNHPGRGKFRGATTESVRLRDLICGLQEQSLLERASTLLSGYLGTAENGEVVLEALSLMRKRHSAVLYCCDPVLGDRPKGLYVAPDIPELVRDRLLPEADLVMPNSFELELLTGHPVGDRGSAIAAARILADCGPETVVVTGLPTDDGIETLAVQRTSAWVVRTPLLTLPTSGAGDALSALFLARFIEKRDVPRALSLSVSALHLVLEHTAKMAADELRLIECQDLLPAPPRLFRAVRAE